MPLLVLLALALMAGAAEPNPHQVGVAVLVQPSAERALGLARSGWLVQALADEAGRQRLRDAAAGTLGRNLWVETWHGAIPMTGQTADLVEGPDGIGAEARRVVVPGSGIAKVGNQTIRVPRPESWAGWSHWMGTPGNNPGSADTDIGLPLRIAWLAKPYIAGCNASARVAGEGIVYLASGPPGGDAWRRGDEGSHLLTAQSLHNGTLLWTRPLPKGSRASRSGMIALGTELLLADGGVVRRLDGTTGKEVGTIAIAAGREVKWMACDQGLLAVLVGPVDPPSQGFWNDSKTKAKDIEEGRLNHGDELVVVDPATGNRRWSDKPPAPVDGRAVAIAEGRLIYLIPRKRVVAFELKTGRKAWVQEDAQVIAWASGDRQWDVTVGLEERPSLVCANQVAVLAPADAKHAVAFSLADGKVLWHADRKGGRAMLDVIVNDRICVANIGTGGVLDLFTGKKTGDLFASGCGVFTAANHLIFGQAGGPALDLSTGKSLPQMPLKTQCLLGGFVADGRAVYLPAECRCQVVFGGIALRKGASTLAEMPLSQRLEKGRPGDDAPAAAVAGDWPTHRGDIRRSGSSPVPVPKLRQLWYAKPGEPFPIQHRNDEAEWRCLPPVTLGDLTVVAAGDGSVRAFHSSTGAVRWTYWCGGPVLAPATIDGGRVYVGSADGSIVCLSAVSGAMRWRFNAAPADERLPIYGSLQSPWPVNSGVAVHEGVAYAVSGMPLSPPATVWALDASTGSVRWSRSGEWNPGGGLAIIGGRLWIRGFNSFGAGLRFRLSDGAPDPDLFQIGTMRGREIAQVAPGLVMYGGGEVYRDAGTVFSARSEGLAMMPLDADGRARLPGLQAMTSALVAPAGDGDLLLLTGGQQPKVNGYLSLEGWDAAKTIGMVDAQTSACDLKKMAGWQLSQLPEQLPDKLCKAASQRRWGPLPLMVHALVLAKDAVVTTAVDSNNQGRPQGAWKLLVLDRTTGATRQALELPGEPAIDGLALTRTGGAVVALRDGGVIAFGP